MSAAQFWAFPNNGAVPDLSDLLQARTLDELQMMAEPWEDAALAGLEAERERAVDELRATAAELARKGIHMDVDGMMRPSLLERLQDWWWARGDRRDAHRIPPAADGAQVFAVAVQLAQSRPPKQVAMEYDAQDRELARFLEALSLQIAAQRGQPGWRVQVPEAVPEEGALDAYPSDDEMMLHEAGDITAYWPPNGQPALMLSVSQEDSDLPIMVHLLAHGTPAHRRFLGVLEAAGGALLPNR